MSLVEAIGEPEPLAYIVRQSLPDETTFVTPPTLPLQVGFIVYEQDGEVPRHRHLPVNRSIDRTCEVLLLRKGRCELDVYDEAQNLVATRTLDVGDLVLLVSGGHALRMTEDTVLLEVKQGPYEGVDEKLHF